MRIPSGTVTFLFTDIEGSTRLWEEHPAAMRVALARHDALMRATIEHNDGHIFKTMGDAFCAAFHTALNGLNAALALQQALEIEAWPPPVHIKIRMALHTGAAEARDNDYFGPPLNRVARLMATGYGGQVLLSNASQELARDTLPPSVSLLNLGEHRLRDLNRSETVFQLLHPSLPSEFPPLKSLDNPNLPNNLPLQLTSFIGREKAMGQIKALLTETRLLTLTGSGGTGKTRFALQLAADVLEQFPDGVWLVELAPLTDPGLVAQTVAQALGIKEEAEQPIQQTLLDSLKSKHLLLVLDNCEHLLIACAQFTSVLLRACPQVKTLATSREALGIAGEQTYRVLPLSLPDLTEPTTTQSVSQYEAVRLFIERAQLLKTDFLVTNANAPALAQVCSRLGGIPLAIELAAARARSLSVEDINMRLDNRFRLLTGGDRSALPRQQTLRAAIDWSYDLLNAHEKLLFGRLTVFTGGWTLEAAETVGAGEGIEGWDVVDLLMSLVDKSLVMATEQHGSIRYRLLETVREYAKEKVTAEEHVTLARRHLGFFRAFVEAADEHLKGPTQTHWLEKLEAEHDNLRTALEWCGTDPQSKEAGLCMVGSLWRFWGVRGYLSEGRAQAERALGWGEASAHSTRRADALNTAGLLAHEQSDYAAARAFFDESLGIWRELGDTQGCTYALNNLARVAHEQHDYATARTLSEEGLAIMRDIGDKHALGNALLTLGNVFYAQGEYEEAHSRYEESLSLLREVGDTMDSGTALNNLGTVAFVLGDYPAARAFQEQCLAIKREAGHRHGIAMSLNNLGTVATAQGDYGAARLCQEESLAIRQEIGDQRGIAMSLHNLGEIAFQQGNLEAASSLYTQSLTLSQKLGDKAQVMYTLIGFSALAGQGKSGARAARLLGAAEGLRDGLGVPLSPREQEMYIQQVAQTRSTLNEPAFTAAWEEGRAMTLEQAVGYVLKEK